jgi:hypothetical protein
MHAGCHAVPGDENRSAANTGGTMPKKKALDLNACAGSEVGPQGACDCGAVMLLSTQIVRKTGESNFHLGTTRHIPCSTVVNAFQQYEWLASLATAK